jgi:hypothetical protein
LGRYAHHFEEFAQGHIEGFFVHGGFLEKSAICSILRPAANRRKRLAGRTAMRSAPPLTPGGAPL